MGQLKYSDLALEKKKAHQIKPPRTNHWTRGAPKIAVKFIEVSARVNSVFDPT
jgi:hypothetical protein